MLDAFIFNTTRDYPAPTKMPAISNQNAGGSKELKKNMRNSNVPISPVRGKVDINSWRDADRQAIRAILPYRTLMQRLYWDTVEDSQVKACLLKRYNLTLGREFAIVDQDGTVDDYWTSKFDKTWVRNIIRFFMDAQFYGYTLISLGDEIKNSKFINTIVIPRDHISPDRKVKMDIPDNPVGTSWEDPEYAPYHIYVPTINEHGTSACGMGLLYTITRLTIMLRDMMTNNANYMQLFSMPFRAIFSDCNDDDERNQLEIMMNNFGSLGYGIFTKEDKLEYMTAGGGNGSKSFDTFEKRVQGAISKILLGHADAIDSTAGHIGGSQNGKESAAQMALYETRENDANFVTTFTNEQLLPRMKELLFNDMPDGLEFKFLNGEEEVLIQEQTDNRNLLVSEMVMNMARGGKSVSNEWITEQTGILIDEKPVEVEPTEQQ